MLFTIYILFIVTIPYITRTNTVAAIIFAATITVNNRINKNFD